MNVHEPRTAAPITPALPPVPLRPPAMKRRGSPLPAASAGRQDAPIRPATPSSQGLPGQACAHPAASPRSTPLPTSAHPTPRAIRVHRSPR
ncbi:hypothetical protein FB157_102405 [Streptomyces sp. BK340]|nr:hypothetical protein FB157_102405 [Streptomyces sp. BK340]